MYSGKRVNFISVQNSSTVAAVGYDLLPFRTGYEQIIANRVDSIFARSASEEGKVIEVSENLITVQYKSGKKESVKLGVTHGIVSGVSIPHPIITDLKLGARVRENDIIAYNSNFFKRDLFEKGKVSFKAGVICKTVLWESSETTEDSCVIAKKFEDRLVTPTSYTKHILADSTTAIYNLVKVGDIIEYDSILCTLMDAVSSELSEADPEAIEALKQISSSNPRAKVYGVVSDIEVIYYGNVEDMNSTLQKIIKDGNKKRKEISDMLGDGSPTTGEVKERIHFGGQKLLKGSVGIAIHIDSKLPIGSGDKLVFANALKTTIARVSEEPLVAENGDEIDAIFGYKSISDRIVFSPEISGTMNTVLKKLSTEMANIYRKG